MSKMDKMAGPAAALAEPEAPGGKGCAAAGTKTILLLDSVEVFVRFEETILQRRDWRVLCAATGAAALEILASERVDLLVMDHVLPDLQGAHLIRAMRSKPELRSTSILIVTAAANQADVDACIAEGANAFLLKPVSRASLCRAVEELLCVAARRHVRTLVRLDVEDGGGRRAVFGQTVNLSAGGMLVESSAGLSVGECIDLRFHLPGDPVPVVVMARVVRGADPGGGQWGFSFERLDEGDRRRIDDFVSSSSGAPVGWGGSLSAS